MALSESYIMNKSIYGYFDSPHQEAPPAYDPGLDALCPVCNKPIGEFTPNTPNIKTISLMLVDPELGYFLADRSYFYRVHKVCYENLSDEQQAALDWPIIDAAALASRTSN